MEIAAKLLIEEITEGMNVYSFEGPERKRSAARASVIKVASDYQKIVPAVQTACEAAGLAHSATGAPILTHTELGTMGLEQIGPGRIKYLPEGQIIDLITKMFELGLGGQIVLGGDNARRSYWKAYGGGPGIAYILEKFVPRLRSEGFSQDQIDMLLVKNAARVFAFRED